LGQDSELIRECEARLHFITEKLQIEVTTEEIELRIAQLKASILKEDPKSVADEAVYLGDLEDRGSQSAQADGSGASAP
jgi:hypothetical protein